MVLWALLGLTGCPAAAARPTAPAPIDAPTAARTTDGTPTAVDDEPSAEAVAKTSAPAWSTADDPSGIRPCRKGTPAHDAARAAYDAFAKLVHGLAPTDDPQSANRSLADLLKHPCFESATLDTTSELLADSGLAMKHWWDNGGSTWLEHYLELWDEQGDRTWWRFNDMPKTLTLDGHRSHPLANLLCAHGNDSCGRETRGWLTRANAHLELFAHKRHKRRNAGHSDDCEAQADAKPESERYDAWVLCERHARPKREALPIGTFRQPRDGWLVIWGRRGHYGFCDEVRAYGLKRGALFAARSCSRLALRNDGSVDQRQTNATRRVVTEVSRLPLQNLREAALMILLSREATQAGIWSSWGRSIPKGMKAVRNLGTIDGLFGASSSGHTTLRWSYVRNGAPVVGGTLQYPDDLNDAAKDHAIRLLLIAEAGSQGDCAPEALPVLPFGGRAPGVSPLDADRRSVADAKATLVTAIRRLQLRATRCAP
jgi:hypothetical protein